MAGRRFAWPLLYLVGGLLPAPLPAQQVDDRQLRDALAVKTRTVQHMALNPVLIQAVKKQNAASLDLTEIKQRDQQWRDSKDLTPFKLSLQTSEAGAFLSDLVQRNDSFSEAFVTDNQGANVAAFPATSDYWQGDEEKWLRCFNDGRGQVFMGPLELDESSNTYAAQISAPVMNRGETIGVLVVGVTLGYIEEKVK